jgi:hypothetical protein
MPRWLPKDESLGGDMQSEEIDRRDDEWMRMVALSEGITLDN